MADIGGPSASDASFGPSAWRAVIGFIHKSGTPRDEDFEEDLRAFIQRRADVFQVQLVSKTDTEVEEAGSRWKDSVEVLAQGVSSRYRELVEIHGGALKIEGIDSRAPDSLMMAALTYAGICPLWPFC